LTDPRPPITNYQLPITITRCCLLITVPDPGGKIHALMNRLFQSRRWIAFISAASLIAMTILAIGLRDFTFRPGQSVGEGEAISIQVAFSRVVGAAQDVVWWEQLAIWGTLFLVVLLIGTLLSPEGRRRLIQGFLRMAAIFLCLYFIMKYRADLLFGLIPTARPQASGADSGGFGPPPIFEPPQLSSLVIFLISLGIALAMVIVGIAFNRWWTRRQAGMKPSTPMTAIARIARSSLADLHAGRAWNDVIVDCYARMARVLETRRGLYRQEAMTPTEFAARLEKAGLPGEAVHGLTKLFEGVRYGARQPTRPEVDRAVACLTAILHSCGETA
jgi:hypothetical protein